MKTTTNVNAVIYCRISKDRSGAGLGVERQEKDCRALAEAQGLTVTNVFVDDDISAYSGKKRPSYRRLLDRVQQGDVRYIIAWHTDRLHRSPLELEEYIQASEANKVNTLTVQSGELDLSTPSGRAVARTLGAWARFESEHKAERIKRKHRESAEAGRWAGGARPFGWIFVDGVPTIDEAEAERVRYATTTVLAGGSLGGIVRGWNDADVKTSLGGKWSYATLRQMLMRARNCGLSSLHGEIVGVSEFPAIVTEDAWRSVCSILTNPERRTTKQPNRVKWLLAGLAFCGCGLRLKSGTVTYRNGTKHRVYRCPATSSGHVVKRAEYIEEYVVGVILGVLSRPGMNERLSTLAPADMQELQTKAITLRARLDEVADSFTEGNITLKQLERITHRVNSDLTSVEAQMVASHRDTIVSEFAGPAAAEKWKAATIERRRAVLDDLATVTILSSPKTASRVFNPDLIQIVPKI